MIVYILYNQIIFYMKQREKFTQRDIMIYSKKIKIYYNSRGTKWDNKSQKTIKESQPSPTNYSPKKSFTKLLLLPWSMHPNMVGPLSPSYAKQYHPDMPISNISWKRR